MDVVIKGETACGDLISYNGLMNYLQKYYNNIYFYLPNDLLKKEKRFNTLDIFAKELYKDNKKIKFINNFSNFKNVHFIDACCRGNITNLLNLDNKRFINKNNKINNVLNIDEKDIDKTNEIPNNNSDFFYKLLGLKVNIKRDYFLYSRNIIEEEKIYNKFKKDKYIITNDCNQFKINNKYLTQPIINIHFLVPNQLYLLKLIENAEELHLMENSLALMIYHMQYSNIIKPVKVYYHTYPRKRVNDKNPEICNNVFISPKLDNWTIINK